MSRIDIEELLRQTAEQETSEGVDPGDEALEAYRSGRLPAAEAQRLEALLAHNPTARQHLLMGAGLEREGPSPGLRRRVLARFPSSGGRFPLRRRWPAAAALAAALILVFGLRLRPPEPLPEGLSYDVLAFGIADSRTGPAASGRIRARPETSIRLEIAPRGEAESGVEFGIYRLRGARLERVRRAGDRALDVSRGAVAFEARASELVGDEPGIYTLLVAVARRGDLPAELRLEPGRSAPDTLAAGGRRRVYPREIRLLPAGEREGSP